MLYQLILFSDFYIVLKRIRNKNNMLIYIIYIEIFFKINDWKRMGFYIFQMVF